MRTIIGLFALMVLSLALVSGQAQKTGRPVTAADLTKKADGLYEDGKWKDAKAVYQQLLRDFAADPAVSGSVITLQERIMRCDFYNEGYDLKKVLAEDFGLKDCVIREGRVPYIEVTFDFSDEKQGKFFGGGEVIGGSYQGKGGSGIGCMLRFRDPFSMEFTLESMGGAGLMTDVFGVKDYKGNGKWYRIVGLQRGGVILFEEKALVENRAVNMGVASGDTVKISKIKNRLSFEAGTLKMQTTHAGVAEGPISLYPYNVQGQESRDLRIDNVRIKSQLSPNEWASLKGDLESSKWIPFKMDYAKKYGSFTDSATKPADAAAAAPKTEEDKKKEDEAREKMMQERADRLDTDIILTSGFKGVLTGFSEEDLKTLISLFDLFNQKKYNDADKQCTTLVDKYPDQYLWLYMRGVVRLNNSNTEGALADLAKAREMAPTVPHIPFAQGLGYWAKEEFVKAEQAFQATTAIDPKFVAAYLYECFSLYIDDNIDAAVAKMDEYAAKFPDDEIMQMGKKMFYLMKNGPEWAVSYKSEGAHYIVYSERSQEEANKFKTHLEAVYNFYTKFFPYLRKDKKKFNVFIFGSYGSLLSFAMDSGTMAHPNMGGYFNDRLDVLVIRGDRSERDALETLYHEGFHQYLSYYIKDAPIWFNEGLATFFECSYFEGGSFHAGVVNKGRLQGLVAGLEGRFPGAALVTLKEFMLFDPSGFMGNIGNQAILNYSQAWSVVYFLLMNPEFMDKYLRPYFKLLKEGKSKDEAFTATFAPVIHSIEVKWKDYYQSKKYPQK
ncbi:MAG: tetratricopeptide repeat protein [Planctomycetota bacterium]